MPQFSWLTVIPSAGEFTDVVARKPPKKPETEVASAESSSDSETELCEQENDGLFICSEEGCGKVFMRYHAFNEHLLRGKHERKLEQKTLADKAKTGYAQRLEDRRQALPSISCAAPTGGTQATAKSQGWALRVTSKGRAKFNSRQKEYLESKYDQGEATGVKVKPEDVAKEMRYLKDGDNNRVLA